jgi:hypothetical protein
MLDLFVGSNAQLYSALVSHPETPDEKLIKGNVKLTINLEKDFDPNQVNIDEERRVG